MTNGQGIADLLRPRVVRLAQQVLPGLVQMFAFGVASAVATSLGVEVLAENDARGAS